MKNVLIIGSTGQIGSELTMKLRAIYGGSNIVAGYINGAEPKGELLESGPAALVDITNPAQIAEAVDKYKIDTIYNLAALLSAVAEAKPQLAWKIGIGGLFNTLEVAREKGCAVFTPSSIGSFGDDSPKDKTPQDTVRNPRTMYGVTKVSGETAQQLLFLPLWRRHPLRQIPRADFLCDSPRRRYDRLCRRHLLCRCEGTDVQMPDCRRHIYGYDVYAGRIAGRHRNHGSRPRKIRTPQLL